MYVTEVSTRRSLVSLACSGQITPPQRGSSANPLCYRFLTPRPVLGAPQSSGGPSLTPWSLRVRVSCGTRWVRTLVLREFKELCDRPALTGAIPLLLGAGTLNCTASPQQQDDPTPRLEVTSAKNANQHDPRASADAESARNNLPRASCPQDILKVRPPNSLDHRAHCNTLAEKLTI